MPERQLIFEDFIGCLRMLRAYSDLHAAENAPWTAATCCRCAEGAACCVRRVRGRDVLVAGG